MKIHLADAKKQGVKCLRCGRILSDPVSIRRGLGPYCWQASRGGLFVSDLKGTKDEWARREALLQRGGEVDFGYWSHAEDDLVFSMRVSVRYRDGFYEAYGVIYDIKGPREIVFYRTSDVREAYEAATMAGPQSQAMAERALHA